MRVAVNEAGYGLAVVAGAHVRPKSASSNAHKDRNHIFDVIKTFDAKGFIIVVPSVCYELGPEEIEEFVAGYNHVPMVCIGQQASGRSCVLLDSSLGMSDCMTHLIDAPENQTFAFVGGVKTNSDSIKRENIFRQHLKDAGKTVDEDLIVYGQFIPAKAYEAVIELVSLRRDIDVIVCVNDGSAQGAIYALEFLGLSVPRDIRVTGFDDNAIATRSSPTISSVTQPHTEIAIKSAQVLLDNIKMSTDAADTVLIKTQFVPRESTRCSSQIVDRVMISNQDHDDHGKELANCIVEKIRQSEIEKSVPKDELINALFEASRGNATQIERCLKRRFIPAVMTHYDVNWWQSLAGIIEDRGSQLPDSNVTDALQSCMIPHVQFIHESLRQWQVRQDFETRRLLQIYERFLTDVSAAVTLESMCDHLETWASDLGIERAFFSVCSTFDTTPSPTSRLAFCHFSDRASLPADWQPFDTSDLLPESLNYHFDRGLLVVHSVTANGLQFGHLIVDPGKIDSSKIDSGTIVSARLDAVVDGLGNAMMHMFQANGTKKNAATLKKANERLFNLAHYDELTRLPNRNHFKENLDSVLANASKNEELVALAFVDLDGFKVINDSLGHTAGDHLLSKVADRLRTVMGKDALLARLGGDEFTIIFRSITKGDLQLSGVKEKIQEVLYSLSESFQISKHSVHVSASVGVAMYPSDARDRDALIRKADVAMYHAKNRGKNGMCLYTEDLDRNSSWQHEQDLSMRRGLIDDEFYLVFQPKYSLSDGTVTGAEALIRWHSDSASDEPQLPSTFIPVAENTWFILQLDEFVIDSACAALRRWQNRGAAIPVAVNVSALHVHKPELVNTVAECIKRHGVNPQLLELEITESAAMTDVERSIEQLTRLQELGVRIAIDDFGTGHSSLAYLKRLPVDTLKIDQSFLKNTASSADSWDEQDVAIIKAIIDLGRSMHYKVVAEGIEQGFQKKLLARLGAHEGQGYLFAWPMLESDFTQLLFDVPSQTAR